MRQITPYRNRESLWDFMSEVEKAFDEFWQPVPQRGMQLEAFTPAVDVQETKDNFLVSVDVPGIPQKDIKIDVHNGRLTVSGERSRETNKEDGMFKRYERSYGRFERSFSLPQGVNPDSIQARCEDGVLEILIPKVEAAKPKSIEINKDKGGLFSKLLNRGESRNEAPATEKH